MSSFSYYSPFNSMWSSAFNPSSSSTSTATAKTFYPPAVSPGSSQSQTREGEVEERLISNSTPSYSSDNNLKTSSPTTASFLPETNIKTEYTEGELYPAAPTSLRKDGEGVCSSSSGYPSLEKGPGVYPIDKGPGYLLEKVDYPGLEKGYPGYPPAPPLPSPLYTGGYTTGPSLPTDYARPKPKSKAASAGKLFVCMFAWN